ncbi:MAG: PilT/PilU family type 4a pilus ATPase [Polyangiaceae bacterium]
MTQHYASTNYLHQLLGKAVAAEASDVHLKVGQPPGVRVGGEIVYFKVDPLTPADTEAVARLIIGGDMTPDEVTGLHEHDTAYMVEGVARFRVNIYKQRGHFSIVMRSIPLVVPRFETLGLPKAVAELATLERGLILVVGAAGNGKSTTLAAMVDLINRSAAKHIVTIEDPVEFIHQDQRGCVSQREVGFDTGSFASALRAALRQDPDVILVGEIRDGETMEIAVQAAETGHLVMSTMHTPDVSRSVNRLLALAENPTELRQRIASCLQGVIAQRLVPRLGGGMAAALEVLVATGTVREALRRPDQNPPLKELMERGVTPYGMQTFKMALQAMQDAGLISAETAHTHRSD